MLFHVEALCNERFSLDRSLVETFVHRNAACCLNLVTSYRIVSEGNVRSELIIRFWR